MLPSDQAKQDIDRNVRAAMAAIRRDIDEAYDTQTGYHAYGPNRGRMSISEVLRRAGNVNKNTLKEPYHAQLRKDVLKFVEAEKLRLIAHQRSEARKRAALARTDSELIDWYAQVAKAADFRADKAESVAKELSDNLAESEAGRTAALKQVETLQIQLSEGRVVRLHSSR